MTVAEITLCIHSIYFIAYPPPPLPALRVEMIGTLQIRKVRFFFLEDNCNTFIFDNE